MLTFKDFLITDIFFDNLLSLFAVPLPTHFSILPPKQAEDIADAIVELPYPISPKTIKSDFLLTASIPLFMETNNSVSFIAGPK